jgi:cytochrome c-type biogenesis protein CcmH
MTKMRRSLGALLFCVMALAPLAAMRLLAQDSDRVKQIGGKFLCMCGCNQVLTQCNHVGCQTSTAMLKELGQAVARGDSETAITQMFVQEYGTSVYAEPPKSGFSLVAWSMPTVYLVLGTILVVFIIHRWRKRAPASATSGAANVSPEVLARARAQAERETED